MTVEIRKCPEGRMGARHRKGRIEVEFTELPDPPPGWVHEAYLAWLPDSDEEFVHKIVPDGFPNLLHLHGPDGWSLLALGQFDHPLHLDITRYRVSIGVSFRPDAAAAVFGAPAARLNNRAVPLEDLWGADAVRLAEALNAAGDARQERARILSHALRRREPLAVDMDPRVTDAVRRIEELDGVVSVGGLADAVGMSSRQLRRLFRTHVGPSPKALAGIVRFQQVVRRVMDSGGDLDWGREARRLGFYDQAHLTRELNRYSGMTPTRMKPAPGSCAC